MTQLIRELIDIEFRGYKYLGNGVLTYKSKGKTIKASFNDVYNMLLEYGVDETPAKVKVILNQINDFKSPKKKAK